MIKVKKRARVAQPIDPAKLKAYVERIENVETRIAEERDARTDIYTEVKASGMKPKMVRKIIKERAKKDEDAAEQAELEAYRTALAMPGATYRSVAEKTGVPRSTLHRLVPKNKNGTGGTYTPTPEQIASIRPQTPHDADGVIIETDSRAACGADGGDKKAAQAELPPESHAGAAGGADAPAPIPPQNGATGTAKPVGQVAPPEAQAPPTVEIGAVAEPKAERVAPNLYQRSQPVDDDLKIPHFLRRVPA